MICSAFNLEAVAQHDDFLSRFLRLCQNFYGALVTQSVYMNYPMTRGNLANRISLHFEKFREIEGASAYSPGAGH